MNSLQNNNGGQNSVIHGQQSNRNANGGMGGMMNQSGMNSTTNQQSGGGQMPGFSNMGSFVQRRAESGAGNDFGLFPFTANNSTNSQQQQGGQQQPQQQVVNLGVAGVNVVSNTGTSAVNSANTSFAGVTSGATSLNLSNLAAQVQPSPQGSPQGRQSGTNAAQAQGDGTTRSFQ